MTKHTEKKNVISAFAGWAAARVAGVLRPAYQPVFLAEDSTVAANELAEAYRLAVAKGLEAAGTVVNSKAASAKGGLPSSTIETNVKSVGESFAKAAATLDPDGLATEIVRLFCVGVPHMDNLDNRRRVVMVWASILAPSVVMRQFAGQEIKLDSLAVLAQEWVAQGYTAAAMAAHAAPKCRFIARHPARIYDLLADTAAAHEIDHAKLIRSVIEPVLLSVGHYVGAHGFDYAQNSQASDMRKSGATA